MVSPLLDRHAGSLLEVHLKVGLAHVHLDPRGHHRVLDEAVVLAPPSARHLVKDELVDDGVRADHLVHVPVELAAKGVTPLGAVGALAEQTHDEALAVAEASRKVPGPVGAECRDEALHEDVRRRLAHGALVLGAVLAAGGEALPLPLELGGLAFALVELVAGLVGVDVVLKVCKGALLVRDGGDAALEACGAAHQRHVVALVLGALLAERVEIAREVNKGAKRLWRDGKLVRNDGAPHFPGLHLGARELC
mmetsp:Transcript_36656/g.93633  ORF Transcript_36656/g.93633 Transcript_36656/m.93633 type:complete len:251 (+) Transcript_36656:488-1240(+)